MTRGWPIAMMLSLLLGGACTHTRSTDSGGTKKADRQASGKGKAGEPGTGTNPELHPGHPEKVPVVTEPEALLVPDADDQIREKLVARGFLAADAKPSHAMTRDGIRRFQQAEDLPDTGIPDQETVKRLGLEPDKVFRKATVKD